MALYFSILALLFNSTMILEYQTMRMIASGKTVSGIAKELSLSVKTVSTYRSRILEKMNMKNNAAITYYAIKQGLVD